MIVLYLALIISTLITVSSLRIYPVNTAATVVGNSKKLPRSSMSNMPLDDNTTTLLYIPPLQETGAKSIRALQSLSQYKLYRADCRKDSANTHHLQDITLTIEEFAKAKSMEQITLLAEGTAVFLALYLASRLKQRISLLILVDPESKSIHTIPATNQQIAQNARALMEAKRVHITTPTLLLLSHSNGFTDRIEELLANTTALEVKDIRVRSGHTLLDGDLDLREILNSTRTLGPTIAHPPIDISPPSYEDRERTEKQVQLFVRPFSPIFLHKDEHNRLRRGIQGLPLGSTEGRPVLYVGNHQLYGLDTSLIVREFLLERDTLIRSLAHPAIFSGDIEKGVEQLFAKFGAVPVSPYSIYELMKRNETILLFPGGANDAYHGKGEQYTLHWDSKTDFVRMASLFNAIIVPYGAIGMYDSFNMVIDSNEMRSLPIIGRDMKRYNSRLRNAKAAVKDNLIPPLASPQFARRNYILFQQPYDTSRLNTYDKRGCKEAYLEIKKRVEGSFVELQAYRRHDPYDHFIPRAVYETLQGKPAPSAPLNIQL